jgi:hypothetical protein
MAQAIYHCLASALAGSFQMGIHIELSATVFTRATITVSSSGSPSTRTRWVTFFPMIVVDFKPGSDRRRKRLRRVYWSDVVYLQRCEAGQPGPTVDRSCPGLDHGAWSPLPSQSVTDLNNPAPGVLDPFGRTGGGSGAGVCWASPNPFNAVGNHDRSLLASFSH